MTACDKSLGPPVIWRLLFAFVFLEYLRILKGKCTLKLNSSAHEKYEYTYLGRWWFKLTLFNRF